jgi:tetratricopeptide (TPR) repeat protein
MRVAALLLVLCWSGRADWLQDVRTRGTRLETEQKWQDAANLYRSALDRADAESVRDRGWLLMSLAEIAFEQQDYRDARRWLREAERTVERLPHDAPERGRMLNNRASLLLVEGKLTAAEELLLRTVAFLDAGGAPLDRAAALHNLASVEMQTGRVRQAEDHAREALAIRRRELGGQHRYVLKGWISLSTVQALSGDWRSAESSLPQALAIAETPEALANYAVVLDKLKRRTEAAEVRSRLQNASVSTSHLVDAKARPYEPNRPRVAVR